MNSRLLQDTIDYMIDEGCHMVTFPKCNGPTMKPTADTCPRCAILARLLRSQQTYKPRAKRGNMYLNLTQENP